MTERPRLCQVAWSVADLPASYRFYSEVAGFRPTSGRVLWGEPLRRVQGLDGAHCVLWWMAGAQDFLQLELFAYSRPRPASKARPGYGYSSVSFTVPDLDAAGVALGAMELPYERRDGIILTADPDAVPVRLVESRGGEQVGDGTAHDPSVQEVTLAVTGLDRAAKLFHDTLGFEVSGHQQDGAEGVRLDGGAFDLLIVPFDGERAPTRASAVTDLGLMNVAVGWRDARAWSSAFDRLSSLGLTAPERPAAASPVKAAYFRDESLDITVELLSFPEELDALLGFKPPNNQ